MKHLFPFGLPLPLYRPEGDPPASPPPADPPAGDPPPKDPPLASPPASPPPSPPAAPNALRDGPQGDPKPTPADFPADWREKLAGSDTKLLERLKRMPAPGDLLKAYVNADAKINSGKLNADEPMPDDPEKAKEWRKARDIPEDAAGYTVPDEIKGKLTDEDKPIIAGFSEAMHKLGMPQKYHAGALTWYTSLVEQQAEQQAADDKEASLEVRDKLKEEWGADYKGNSTLAQRYAEEAIPGVDWYSARLPDGRALGNIPEVVKALAKFGAMEYGDAAFAGGEQANRTSARYEELQKIMREDFDKWERSPELRREYNELIAARERRAARSGGS